MSIQEQKMQEAFYEFVLKEAELIDKKKSALPAMKRKIILQLRQLILRGNNDTGKTDKN